jgi:hypothetical protein
MNAGRLTSSALLGTSPFVTAGKSAVHAPALDLDSRFRGNHEVNNPGRVATSPTAGQPTVEAELTKHVETFVASSFFGTMLKQMRESPFRSELFGGGRAGGAYDAMYHQALAERMGRGVGQSLVRSIVKRIMGARAENAPSAATSNGSKLNLNA